MLSTTTRYIAIQYVRLALVVLVGLAGTLNARSQGQYTGALASGDNTLTSGEYADDYSVSVDSGDWIAVTMTSSQIDSYLIVKPPSCPGTGTCEAQIDNDDVQSGDATAMAIIHAQEAGSWAVLATSSVPGETGSYQVNIDVADDVSSFRSMSFLILHSDDVRSEAGYLEEGDKTLNSGEYVDNYAFVGFAGQSVVIDLTSSEFDPYVILFMPDKTQEDNDDWEESQEHSRLEIVLPLDGMYRASVTSYAPGESGGYSLQIRDEVPFVKD